MTLTTYCIRLALLTVFIDLGSSTDTFSRGNNDSYFGIETALDEGLADITNQQRNFDVILPSSKYETDAIAYAIASQLPKAFNREAKSSSAYVIESSTNQVRDESMTNLTPFVQGISTGIANAISIATDPESKETKQAHRSSTPGLRSTSLQKFAKLGKPSILVRHAFKEIKKAVKSSLASLDPKRLHAIASTKQLGVKWIAVSLASEISQRLEAVQPSNATEYTVIAAFTASAKARKASMALKDAMHALAEGKGTEEEVAEANAAAVTSREAAVAARSAALGMIGRGIAVVGVGAGALYTGMSVVPVLAASGASAKAYAVAGADKIYAGATAVGGLVKRKFAEASLFNRLGMTSKIGMGIHSMFGQRSVVKRLDTNTAGDLAGEFYIELAGSPADNSDAEIVATRIASIVAPAVVAALTASTAEGLKVDL